MHPNRDRIRIIFPILAMVLFCAGAINAQTQIIAMSFEHAAFFVAVNPVTNLIYVPEGHFFDARVTVIDGNPASPTFHQIIAQIDLPDDCSPVEIAVNPVTNRAYIADDFGNRVLIIDTATNSFVGSIAVGTHPRRLAVNSVTNRIYVPVEVEPITGHIAVIDGNSNTVVASIPLTNPTHFPFKLAVNETTNRVYVTSLQGSITVVDGANNSIITTIAGGSLPFGVAVNPVTDRIYVSNLGNSNLSVIPGSTNTIEANIFIGLASNVVAANRVTGRIYAASTGNLLSVVDGRLSSPTYNTVLSSVGSFSGSTDVAVNPNTNFIYLMGGSLLKIFDGSISSPSNAITQMINWVASLGLAQGTTNSLTSKLTNALSALESPNGNDANTACNKLDAFINEAQAQAQKQQLTEIEVRELTTEAQLIKTALGCN